jgi:holo-[acyl-carrier protein] synthase
MLPGNVRPNQNGSSLMILGVGTDILAIQRIERTIKRFGDRFLMRIYSDEERARAARRPHPANMLAMCYAAKEACSKALGTGLRQGVFWRDMAVVHLSSGKPTMRLSGGALKRLRAMAGPDMMPEIEVSLTDEAGLAHAIVLIWARPLSSGRAMAVRIPVREGA